MTARTTQIATYATTIQAMVGTLVESSTDPGALVDGLAVLAAYQPRGGTGEMGAVTAALCRRAALSALCRALPGYNLRSYDDARALLDRVTGLIDDEIEYAGDRGEDRVFAALRRLRAAVTTDLLARGASLAPLTDVAVPQPLPALVLAQRLYGDATRADELVQSAGSPHPAFLSTAFKALAR